MEASARADTFNYAQYKAQQFDRLADVMRQHIDINKINQIMREHRESAE